MNMNALVVNRLTQDPRFGFECKTTISSTKDSSLKLKYKIQKNIQRPTEVRRVLMTQKFEMLCQIQICT